MALVHWVLWLAQLNWLVFENYVGSPLLYLKENSRLPVILSEIFALEDLHISVHDVQRLFLYIKLKQDR